MELRSSRKRNEYKELQITLNGMGFYEEGMELQEMRQILDALHQSVSQRETNFFNDDDMERAIRESEMDFMPSNSGGLWNSTMMGTHQTSSPCSSPEIPPQVITVQAEVHHPLDWSPPPSEEERLQRKRFASTPTKALDTCNLGPFPVSHNEIVEPNAKRSQYDDKDSILQPFHDFNINSTNGDFSNNISNGNDVDNSIQIIGPVSMRRPINDSGVNSGNETTKSTSLSTTPNVTNNNSLGDSNANENVSLSSPNDYHEIVGPISARRPINDSGVNISNENGEQLSSSWEFNTDVENSMENVSNHNNNHLPFAIRNNILENYNDDDYEHSEPSI